MKLKCFHDYIKLFIKEKYITDDENLSWFRVYLDTDVMYKNIHVIFDGKKSSDTFSIECPNDKNIKISKLLKLPVLEARILFYNSDNVVCQSSRIIIDKTLNSVSNKIEYIINPKLSTIKQNFGKNVKWLLMINLLDLTEEYSESFLYDKDIIKPSIYDSLREFGNTVLSNQGYNTAIEYIKEHLSEFNRDNNETLHTILELAIDTIMKSKPGSYRIRYVSDQTLPFYIIENVSKTKIKK